MFLTNIYKESITIDIHREFRNNKKKREKLKIFIYK